MSASYFIPDRFYVISMDLLSLSRRRSSERNVPSGVQLSEEKRLFSQAMLGEALVRMCFGLYLQKSLQGQS